MQEALCGGLQGSGVQLLAKSSVVTITERRPCQDIKWEASLFPISKKRLNPAVGFWPTLSPRCNHHGRDRPGGASPKATKPPGWFCLWAASPPPRERVWTPLCAPARFPPCGSGVQERTQCEIQHCCSCCPGCRCCLSDGRETHASVPQASRLPCPRLDWTDRARQAGRLRYNRAGGTPAVRKRHSFTEPEQRMQDTPDHQYSRKGSGHGSKSGRSSSSFINPRHGHAFNPAFSGLVSAYSTACCKSCAFRNR